jgi:hypothetical protein
MGFARWGGGEVDGRQRGKCESQRCKEDIDSKVRKVRNKFCSLSWSVW